MAEKTALPQVNYISDNPEQDWDRFQDAMKHILAVPKKGELQAGVESEDLSSWSSDARHDTPRDKT
jgi:hypothetical protein